MIMPVSFADFADSAKMPAEIALKAVGRRAFGKEFFRECSSREVDVQGRAENPAEELEGP
jgi:hypothetical protein